MRHRLLLPAAALTATLLMVGSAAVASPGARGGERVDVIVVLHDGADARDAAQDAARDHDARVRYVYEHALDGYAGSVPEGRLHALRNDPRVDYVEHDQRVQATALTGSQLPTGINRIDADANAALDLDGTDDLRVAARVAVLDTGVDFQHGDLNVNTTLSANCLYTTGGGPPWSRNYVCVTGEGDDDNGHGSHVAGTIGALDDGPDVGTTHVVGVAPGAEIVAVKVLDSTGSGYESGVVAGVDYVTSLNQDNNTSNNVDAANMSLGCSCAMSALESAIGNSVQNGKVVYALAAGNSAADVKGYSPAGQPDAITVSALADFDGTSGGNGSPTCRSDVDDTFANFSNYGKTAGDDVDIIAPGVCILSTVPGGYDTYSGTSMAAPHVAGAAALLAASGNRGNPDAIRTKLLATADGVWATGTDPDGSADKLLNVDDATVYAPTMTSTGSEDAGDTTPPAAPSNLTATGADGSVDLNWDDNGDGDLAGYNVYRSTTAGSGYAKINGSSLVTASAYTDSSVTNGTTYYYVVTAVDTSGNESASSNEASATPAGSGGGTSGDLSVTEETYSQFGGKTNDNHLDVSIRVTDGSGQGVGSATVTIDLYRSTTEVWTGSATTDSAGYATFAFRNIGPGCYAADVTSVTATGSTWDGTDPDNTSC